QPELRAPRGQGEGDEAACQTATDNGDIDRPIAHLRALYRRQRDKVIPIRSVRSVRSSFTILTLTWRTLASCRKTVSMIWSATASIRVKCLPWGSALVAACLMSI